MIWVFHDFRCFVQVNVHTNMKWLKYHLYKPYRPVEDGLEAAED